VKRIRWWIVAFFAAEFLFCFGLLVHTLVAPPEDMGRDAVVALLILGFAATVAIGRRVWQCWCVIRDVRRGVERR
jgi:hypothetical protein